MTRPVPSEELETLRDEGRAYADSIIATIQTPLVVLDPDRTIVSMNPAFRALFEDAYVGWPWGLARGGELAQFLDGHNGTQLTYQHAMRDATPRIFLVSANTLPCRSQHVLVALLDITERAYAEHDRDQLREDTARERDEFLDGVSHELKAPLNAIILWAQLLAGGAVDPGTLSRAAETVLRSAREQARAIDDLLALASSRELAVTPAGLDASELTPIRHLVARHEGAIAKKIQ